MHAKIKIICVSGEKIICHLIKVSLKITKSSYPVIFLNIFVNKYINQSNMLLTVLDICFRNVVKMSRETAGFLAGQIQIRTNYNIWCTVTKNQLNCSDLSYAPLFYFSLIWKRVKLAYVLAINITSCLLLVCSYGNDK